MINALHLCITNKTTKGWVGLLSLHKIEKRILYLNLFTSYLASYEIEEENFIQIIETW